MPISIGVGAGPTPAKHWIYKFRLDDESYEQVEFLLAISTEDREEVEQAYKAFKFIEEEYDLEHSDLEERMENFAQFLNKSRKEFNAVLIEEDHIIDDWGNTNRKNWFEEDPIKNYRRKQNAKRNLLRLVKDHRQTCDGPRCTISFDAILEYIEDQGIELDDEERKLFL